MTSIGWPYLEEQRERVSEARADGEGRRASLFDHLEVLGRVYPALVEDVVLKRSVRALRVSRSGRETGKEGGRTTEYSKKSVTILTEPFRLMA